MIRRIREIFRRFRREDEAVAAVEFALILPFLVTLYLGSIEAASLFTVDKRVNSLSATMGDLVAQWNAEDDGTLTTVELNKYMAAAQGILAPYSSTGVQIVVSFVEVSKAASEGQGGTTKVLWSRERCRNEKDHWSAVHRPRDHYRNEQVDRQGRGLRGRGGGKVLLHTSAGAGVQNRHHHDAHELFPSPLRRLLPDSAGKRDGNRRQGMYDLAVPCHSHLAVSARS
jgi:Flp pilus assembly pilin Flp